MAFWSSLVHSSPRVAGLRERALSTYEAGLPTFPQDYTSTSAYDEYEKRREVEDRGYWERRPPAKRPNYVKLGTEHPWNLNLEKMLSTRRTAESSEEKIQPYLVPFKVANSLASSVSKNRMPSQSKSDLNPVEQLERDLREDWTSTTGTKLRNAIVRVRIDPCLRGVPEDFGLIYEVNEEEAGNVRKKMESAKKNEKTFATGEGEGAEDVSPSFMSRKMISCLLDPLIQLCDKPAKEQVIGRITTGTFSLARGQGYGIGVVSFERYLKMVSRDTR